MKSSRYTAEQVAFAMRQAESGLSEERIIDSHRATITYSGKKK
ncbi:hypothetical protein ACFLWH_02180 [Chloroflexota bacterium]